MYNNIRMYSFCLPFLLVLAVCVDTPIINIEEILTNKTISAYDLIQEKKYSQAGDVLNEVFFYIDMVHIPITHTMFSSIRWSSWYHLRSVINVKLGNEQAAIDDLDSACKVLESIPHVNANDVITCRYELVSLLMSYGELDEALTVKSKLFELPLFGSDSWEYMLKKYNRGDGKNLLYLNFETDKLLHLVSLYFTQQSKITSSLESLATACHNNSFTCNLCEFAVNITTSCKLHIPCYKEVKSSLLQLVPNAGFSLRREILYKVDIINSIISGTLQYKSIEDSSTSLSTTTSDVHTSNHLNWISIEPVFILLLSLGLGLIGLLVFVNVRKSKQAVQQQKLSVSTKHSTKQGKEVTETKDGKDGKEGKEGKDGKEGKETQVSEGKSTKRVKSGMHLSKSQPNLSSTVKSKNKNKANKGKREENLPSIPPKKVSPEIISPIPMVVETPIIETPVKNTPVNETPVNETPSNETPVKNIPVIPESIEESSKQQQVITTPSEVPPVQTTPLPTSSPLPSVPHSTLPVLPISTSHEEPVLLEVPQASPVSEAEEPLPLFSSYQIEFSMKHDISTPVESLYILVRSLPPEIVNHQAERITIGNRIILGWKLVNKEDCYSHTFTVEPTSTINQFSSSFTRFKYRYAIRIKRRYSYTWYLSCWIIRDLSECISSSTDSFIPLSVDLPLFPYMPGSTEAGHVEQEAEFLIQKNSIQKIDSGSAGKESTHTEMSPPVSPISHQRELSTLSMQSEITHLSTQSEEYYHDSQHPTFSIYHPEYISSVPGVTTGVPGITGNVPTELVTMPPSTMSFIPMENISIPIPTQATTTTTDNTAVPTDNTTNEVSMMNGPGVTPNGLSSVLSVVSTAGISPTSSTMPVEYSSATLPTAPFIPTPSFSPISSATLPAGYIAIPANPNLPAGYVNMVPPSTAPQDATISSVNSTHSNITNPPATTSIQQPVSTGIESSNPSLPISMAMSSPMSTTIPLTIQQSSVPGVPPSISPTMLAFPPNLPANTSPMQSPLPLSVPTNSYPYIISPQNTTTTTTTEGFIPAGQEASSVTSSQPVVYPYFIPYYNPYILPNNNTNNDSNSNSNSNSNIPPVMNLQADENQTDLRNSVYPPVFAQAGYSTNNQGMVFVPPSVEGNYMNPMGVVYMNPYYPVSMDNQSLSNQANQETE